MQGKLIAVACLWLALCGFGSFYAGPGPSYPVSGTSQNPSQMDAGAFALDGTTQSTFSVYLPATGDSDYDSSAYIEYKESTSGTWIRGMDLKQQRPEYVSITRGLPTNPPGFYGMIWGLDPDTEYDIRVTFSDPDGLASGSASSPQTLSNQSTKALPISDYTGFGTTTISTDNASALTAAIKSACDNPGTGHVITISAGVTVTGTIVVRPTTLTSNNVCGTATTPLVIRGANQATSILDGNGTGAQTLWIASGYVIVENLTVTNARTLIDVFGLNSDREIGNITIRNVIGTASTRHGIKTGGYYINDMYVADNDLTGPRAVLATVTAGTEYGIELSGHDIEVEHNTIRGFIDAIAMSDPTDIVPTALNRSITFHHNRIEWNADDALEFDFTHRNVIGHNNLLVNTGNCISMQPAWGGPAIAAFNVCYNHERGPLKLKAEIDNPHGGMIINNTFIANGSLEVNAGVASTNFDLRNNLHFAQGTLTNPNAWKMTGNWSQSLNVIDYNYFTQDGPYDMTSQSGANFAAFVADGSWCQNCTLVTDEPTTTFGDFTPDFDDTGSGRVFGATPARDASDKTFQLHASSSANDAGVEIPGFTPAGDSAPDVGACEVSGCDGTTTFYGVR